jgi:hypothetical protein
MAINIGKSSSSNRSSMDQNVWDPQGNYQQYQNQGNNLWQQQQPYMNYGYGMMPGMQQQMGDVYNLGMNGMQQQMGGGAYGDTSRYNDMIYDAMANPQQSNQSKMYSDIIGGPGNTYADPLVDAMRGGMNDNRMKANANEGLTAQGMGQGGSNRHAMGNAMNDQNFNRDMNSAEMGIREGNYARDMDWKMGIAQQADSNRQNDLNRAQQMVSGGNQSQQYGMGYGSQAQNLGMGQMAPWMQAMMGPWNAYGQYSQAMGDPTVLTNSKSKGSSSSYNAGAGGI